MEILWAPDKSGPLFRHAAGDALGLALLQHAFSSGARAAECPAFRSSPACACIAIVVCLPPFRLPLLPMHKPLPPFPLPLYCPPRRVTPQGFPAAEGLSATRAWQALYACDAAGGARSLGLNGEQMFGLSAPRVQRALQRLPGAQRCDSYCGWPEGMQPAAPPLVRLGVCAHGRSCRPREGLSPPSGPRVSSQPRWARLPATA